MGSTWALPSCKEGWLASVLMMEAAERSSSTAVSPLGGTAASAHLARSSSSSSITTTSSMQEKLRDGLRKRLAKADPKFREWEKEAKSKGEEDDRKKQAEALASALGGTFDQALQKFASSMPAGQHLAVTAEQPGPSSKAVLNPRPDVPPPGLQDAGAGYRQDMLAVIARMEPSAAAKLLQSNPDILSPCKSAGSGLGQSPGQSPGPSGSGGGGSPGQQLVESDKPASLSSLKLRYIENVLGAKLVLKNSLKSDVVNKIMKISTNRTLVKNLTVWWNNQAGTTMPRPMRERIVQFVDNVSSMD